MRPEPDDREDEVGTDGPDPGTAPAAPPADRGEAWFEALVTAHLPAVHRYLLRRGARDEAEDLTAEVLTVAWRRRGDVPEGAELPWLYRTAGFVLANHRRRHRPVPVADVPDEPVDDDPAHLAVTDDAVRRALLRLSPRDRQVLLLHAWEGLTGAELGAVLGVSTGGAEAALSRARARLRTAWAELDAV
nr:sigma-70 family RNA polymerase sigma factor [Cellulomonas endophytica]